MIPLEITVRNKVFQLEYSCGTLIPNRNSGGKLVAPFF
jgi:hypothetical protein